MGLNGARKTTIFHILSARIFASSGQVHVFGKNAYENIDTLKQICLIEEKGFYDTVIEDFTEHPRTIIISTHLIDEVSRLLKMSLL